MMDITKILNAVEHGDSSAANELLPLVYAELRRLAASQMAREKPGQTLDATALVHEAYLRMVKIPITQNSAVNENSATNENAKGRWESRKHFFASAAQAMRRILIEKARQKKQLKRGGELNRIEFSEQTLATKMPSEELLRLDEALSRLESKAPAKAALVKLRFYVGMKVAEAADVLGISVATAERHWKFSKAWLHNEIADLESTDNH